MVLKRSWKSDDYINVKTNGLDKQKKEKYHLINVYVFNCQKVLTMHDKILCHRQI